MMLASGTPDYIAVRSNPRNTRESSVSPSCRSSAHLQHLNTPPRPTPRSAVYDSPMLTPSPLRKRPLFPHVTDEDDDSDFDIFLQSPFQSPPQRFHAHPAKPLPIRTDDDEGGIFLSAQPTQPLPFSSFAPFPPSSSQPLRTPVKQAHRTPSHSYLSIKHLNAQPHPSAASAFVMGGTKRKESGPDFSTPLRQRNVTPLGISSAQNAGGDPGSVSFDRLAPLPAPSFTTPQHTQSKAETEVHLKKHTETMTKLRICDLDDSDDDNDEESRGPLFSRSVIGNAQSRSTGYAADGAKSHTKATTNAKAKIKSSSLGRSLGASLLAIAQNKSKKGKGKVEEVVEAISPGGHVNKRRARSRPVSQDLLESVVSWRQTSPSPGQVIVRSLNPQHAR
jgi:mitosis inhibitor protein kinase SWE1